VPGTLLASLRVALKWPFSSVLVKTDSWPDLMCICTNPTGLDAWFTTIPVTVGACPGWIVPFSMSTSIIKSHNSAFDAGIIGIMAKIVMIPMIADFMNTNPTFDICN